MPNGGHYFKAYPSLSGSPEDVEGQWLHPDLRRNDGLVSVIVMGDIFRSDFTPEKAKFVSIGCVEQYQFCMLDGICTPWGAKSSHILAMANTLHQRGDSASAFDLQILYQTVLTQFPLWKYLQTSWHTDGYFSFDYLEERPVSEEPWIVEIQRWFETSFLQLRYTTFNLLRPDPRNLSWPSSLPSRETLCSRILFSTSDYQNFDLIQLLIVQSGLLIICVASFAKEIVAGAQKLKCSVILRWKLVNKGLERVLKSITHSWIWQNWISWRSILYHFATHSPQLR